LYLVLQSKGLGLIVNDVDGGALKRRAAESHVARLAFAAPVIEFIALSLMWRPDCRQRAPATGQPSNRIRARCEVWRTGNRSDRHRAAVSSFPAAARTVRP
jgi:hypothetical protein